ncbi:MAG TPA: sigma-54 dependent transcriptional regulator [Verrucomicrobiae bacterium]|nr:sigma-54 dependent transcriptional regulator [Verrucomicrobiae bacterium]
MARAKILVVDHEVSWTLRVSELLMREDYEMFSANTVEDAMLLLDARSVEVVVADINNMPGVDGVAFLEQMRQVHGEAALIVHTARGTVEQAVRATKLGAYDYLEKGVEAGAMGRLRERVGQAVMEAGTMGRGAGAVADARGRGMLAGAVQGFYGIISQNSQMRDIFELIQTIADSYANVLIHGETGTGKELVARAIHEASDRHGKPFVTLDCSALARELLESELFGHERGAFTGAVDRHVGRFERANTGTLFLDEVANINLNVQSKLLRVLQTRTFERVGGTKPISVDVRIIAATNRPLEAVVADGTFREDLYHRLNVVQIDLPPLRERTEDIPLLAMEFLRRFARQNGKDLRGFSDNAVGILCGYGWPGNVRELENVVLQAVVLAKSSLIDSPDLPRRITEAKPTAAAASAALSDQLGEPEKQILVNALRQYGGNIKRTAEILQISRTTLYAKLKKYDIDPDFVR